jgi:hypothetical protein
MGPPDAADRMLSTTDNNAPTIHCPGVLIALATLGCAVAITACGGASSKPTISSDAHLALSECMRAHGVPNFPDPTKGPGGEGMTINQTPGRSTLTVEGIAFTGPAFQAAEKACKLFGGGTAPPAVSESQKLAELQFARCMRKHGVPNFPDPEFPSGGGIMRPAAPGLSRNSPAVRHAAAACNKA